MKGKFQVYVWQGFEPDYTGGLAVAIAASESEARALIVKQRGFSVSNWGELSIHPLNRRMAVYVSGGS